MGPDSQPRETVLERAKAGGRATGLVTTTWIMDATPAAFGAHSPTRGALLDIMRQFIALPVDVLMGGGRQILALAEERDSVDLRAQLTAQYPYIETADELARLDPDTITSLFGLFSDADMPRAPERSPSLSAMMSTALAILERDPDGFFLMVENEGSDTEAHRNVEADILVDEMLDFDEAVRVALAFRADHPETLIIVTADHETGGISITPDSTRAPVVTYATGDHTAAFVPLFAIGPGAERFGGLKDNFEVGRLLLEAVGPRE